MTTIEEKLEIVKNIPPGKKWEDLTEQEREMFQDPQVSKFLTISYSKKCFFCKTKFEKPLCDKDGINGAFLFHIKESHGYGPEMFFDMFKLAIK